MTSAITRPPRAMQPDAWAVWIGLALLLLWDGSRGDIAVMRLFGTPAGFAWREAFLTSTLLHQGGRLLGWAVGLAWALDCWRPLWRGGPSRAERLGWLAVAIGCLLLVPAIKHASHTSCPWDLHDFGGAAHHVSHWALGVADGGPGHCFPSGHASAAFAFLAGYFLLRDSHPGAARAWLAGVLGFGLLFGLAQVARGAHYPSHGMWTAWICWAACVGADRSTRLWRALPGRVHPLLQDRS
jgi:membrane-associated PAP2 superfamily phosphatase